MKSIRTALVAAAGLALALPAGLQAGVMMQGFYWDTPSGWYNTMNNNAYGLRYMTGGQGIDRMYFPPPSKTAGGGYSMGYDVHDYYDVGQYNQHGTTATRFGTQAQLKSATSKYRGYGVSTMADIVLNHRSGGNSEYNPNVGYNTWTKFNNQASGMCVWNYNDFHPSTFEHSDPGAFGGYPDVCHPTGSAPGQPYGDQISWGNWLKSNTNAGFNGGWRYDYVKGIHPWMTKDFRSATGNPMAVGEYWDANTSTLDWWANAANSQAFDFASYYTLKDICNNSGGGGYMPNLVNGTKSFAAKNSWKAVPFVGNHDTDEIFRDKMIGYAYIMTYKGYPCIYWKDYFNYGLATLGGQWGNGIKQLTWARNKLGNGGPNVRNLKTNDGNVLIYCDVDGNSTSPGYVVVINDDSYAWRGSWVQSANPNLKNKTLKAYAWYSPNSGQNYQPASKWCDGNGWVEVWAPPRGYAVYAPNGY